MVWEGGRDEEVKARGRNWGVLYSASATLDIPLVHYNTPLNPPRKLHVPLSPTLHITTQLQAIWFHETPHKRLMSFFKIYSPFMLATTPSPPPKKRLTCLVITFIIILKQSIFGKIYKYTLTINLKGKPTESVIKPLNAEWKSINWVHTKMATLSILVIYQSGLHLCASKTEFLR